jgi:hypothetical protein
MLIDSLCASVPSSILVTPIRYRTFDERDTREELPCKGCYLLQADGSLRKEGPVAGTNALRQPMDHCQTVAGSQAPLRTTEELGSRRTLLLRRRAP